ncbi:MAG: SET domain-containing protein-lysine N-methyltransferase [Acidobacteriaceae bacterium]
MPSKSSAPRLLVRSSDIHAAGVVTLDPIRRGQRVIEYGGPRLPKEVADHRYADRIVTYLFGFGDDGDVIDGFAPSMFLNHSCNPNCETDETKGRVHIIAIRDIAAGEELVYEYNLYDSEIDDSADCYCGAPQCRGTMFSDDELKRRKRLLASRAKRS